MQNLEKVKSEILKDLENRVSDKILEPTNAELLKNLISKAENPTQALQIAALGTTYKRTGFHFDKRLEKNDETIKYLKKRDDLSFQNAVGGAIKARTA